MIKLRPHTILAKVIKLHPRTVLNRYISFYDFIFDYLCHLVSERHIAKQTSYFLMRKLYASSEGKIDTILSIPFLFTRRAKKINNDVSSPHNLFVNTRKLENSNSIQALNVNGYAILPLYLSNSVINELKHKFESIEGHIIGGDLSVEKKASYLSLKKSCDHAPKILFDKITAFSDRNITQIATSPFLLEIAQKYFGCQPIFSGVQIWWSLPLYQTDNNLLSSAAQMYHYDKDWIKFLKIFIYLTNVNEKNGPFVYIKGSHFCKPKEVFYDNRHDDKEIETAYPSESKIVFTGNQGQVFAADTSGFHKGQAVQEGERLILEIEFAISLFGASGSHHKKKLSLLETGEARPIWERAIQNYGMTYGSFFSS